MDLSCFYHTLAVLTFPHRSVIKGQGGGEEKKHKTPHGLIGVAVLRGTTQPNHPTVKTLSFESALESGSLPHCLVVSNEKIINGNVFMKKTVGFSYFQHAVGLMCGCLGQL